MIFLVMWLDQHEDKNIDSQFTTCPVYWNKSLGSSGQTVVPKAKSCQERWVAILGAGGGNYFNMRDLFIFIYFYLLSLYSTLSGPRSTLGGLLKIT